MNNIKYINDIVCGDCLSIMTELPDKCIDMILCDLPYGVTARNEWDNIIPFIPLWNQYKRLIKDNSVIALTATQPFASKLISSNIGMFKYDLIWHKNKKTGFLNAKKMPLREHEIILIFYNKPPIYNPQKTTGHKPVNSFTKHTSDGTNYGKTNLGIKGGGQTDRYPTSIIKIPVVNNDSKEKMHPTQKPVELFEYLIKTYTNENMLILDNCVGSGTTCVAALNLNRKFIGIDINQEYCDLAKNRINKIK